MRFIEEPGNWDEPIEINSIVVTGGDAVDDPLELGSMATEDRVTYYVDFYGEDESIGLDVSGDIRDILRGKIPSIGRTQSTIPVYDYRDATPGIAFYCDLENVLVDRGRGFTQPWMRYWFSVRVELIDENYG